LLTLQPELYWLAAIHLAGIGPQALRYALQVLGNINNIFAANELELRQVGFKPKQIESIKNPDWQTAEQDLAWCEKNHCQIISILDSRYPILLKEIHHAPVVLFVQGNSELLNKPQLAMVGSRNPTAAGKALAEQFAYELVHLGLAITSGFALGIDTVSHQSALSAGGKTLAVFGTGLKTIYPASNRKLAESIQSRGVLISEFSPNEPAHARNFPRRNRIISGLSLGVLVVEAALRSGSLITARIASSQGREVFAIPGSIQNPLVRGCHELIREGAKLVETSGDIVEELGALRAVLPMFSQENTEKRPNASLETKKEPILPSHYSKKQYNLLNKERVNAKKPLSPDKKTRAFLAQMSYEVASFDTIMLRCGLTAGEVSSMLLTLELQGYIRTVRGGYQLK
jgi:DNA processing protein